MIASVKAQEEQYDCLLNLYKLYVSVCMYIVTYSVFSKRKNTITQGLKLVVCPRASSHPNLLSSDKSTCMYISDYLSCLPC